MSAKNFAQLFGYIASNSVRQDMCILAMPNGNSDSTFSLEEEKQKHVSLSKRFQENIFRKICNFCRSDTNSRFSAPSDILRPGFQPILSARGLRRNRGIVFSAETFYTLLKSFHFSHVYPTSFRTEIAFHSPSVSQRRGHCAVIESLSASHNEQSSQSESSLQ